MRHKLCLLALTTLLPDQGNLNLSWDTSKTVRYEKCTVMKLMYRYERIPPPGYGLLCVCLKDATHIVCFMCVI